MVAKEKFPVCPYCGHPLAGRVGSCPLCKTPHHQDCWQANGGCTTLGCTANPLTPNFMYCSLANVHTVSTREAPVPETPISTEVIESPSSPYRQGLLVAVVLASIALVGFYVGASAISSKFHSMPTPTQASTNQWVSEQAPTQASQPTSAQPPQVQTVCVTVTPKQVFRTSVSPTTLSRIDTERAIHKVLEDFERVKQDSRRRVDDSELAKVTTGEALQQGIDAIRKLRESDAYWEISLLAFEVEWIEILSPTSARARVRKVEKRNFYQHGKLVERASVASDLYSVIYDLVLTQHGWRISRFKIEELTPTPGPKPTDTPKPTSRSVFEIEYRGLNHVAGIWQTVGVVKGRVFDRSGRVIVGARVKIAIDGTVWAAPANPATTNPDGWYEFFLRPNQRISFVEITVPGRQVSLSNRARGFSVVTTAASWHHVDFYEQ